MTLVFLTATKITHFQLKLSVWTLFTHAGKNMICDQNYWISQERYEIRLLW